MLFQKSLNQLPNIKNIQDIFKEKIMKQWLQKILDKRIGRFLFISIGMALSTSIAIASLYLIIILCIKYGMWIYGIFALFVFIVTAFFISKKRIIF